MKITQVPIQKTRFIPMTREAYVRKYYMARRFGITAEMFAQKKWMVCPQVNADKPGSGKFSEFLDDLKASCAEIGMTLVFASITNQRLYKYMQKHTIPVLVNGELYNVQIEKEHGKDKR